MKPDFMVEFVIENNSGNKRDNLSDNRSKRSTGNPHFRKSEIAVDHDRVKNDIENSANHLGYHGEQGFSDRLQNAFKGDLTEYAERQNTANGKILRTVIGN